MHNLQNMEKMMGEIHDNLPKGLKQRLEDLEKRSKARSWASLPGLEDEKPFSFFKALSAIRTGDWSDAQFEKEVFDQTKKRALGTSPDSAAGYLVPVQVMTELIELLRAESVVIASGARVIDNLSGSPVLFPKQTGGATVYWVGDNQQITASQPAVGQLQMTPKKAAAMVQLSNSLIAMSNPSAEAMVREDIARAMALAVDLASLRGAGSANQPKGIANSAGILTALAGNGTDGAVLSNLDLFAEMAYQLQNNNALRGKLGFVMNPVIPRNLKKIKIPQYSGDTGVLPLIPFVSEKGLPITDQNLADAMGYPFLTTTQLPVNLTKGNKSNCTEIYFANWAELLIGQWMGMTILASNQAGTAFEYDQTWIRFILQIDTAVRHPESFCLCNDAAIA